MTIDETLKELNAGLLATNDRFEEALRHIANPIAYMQANLRDGETLDGPMALNLANNAEYLRSIARSALGE